METIIIGVDEAGRGPLFGDVYTSAVILPVDNFDRTILKDSKKYSSHKKIAEAYDYIIENCLSYSIDYMTHREIDKYNILQATQKSMHTSIRNVINVELEKIKMNNAENNNINLRQIIKDFFQKLLILVDGNYFKPFTYLYEDELYSIKYECVVKGDHLHKEISAASILAKVSRDKYITTFVEDNPEYEEKYKLSKNKGYGTKEHREGIKKYGYSEFHRKTFKLKEMG